MATTEANNEPNVERNHTPRGRRLPHVLILQGYPASGKTTKAKQIVDKNPNKVIRVNKDDLRAVINNGNYSKPNEHLVLKMRNKIILEAIKAGRDVVVDDTNLNPMHEKDIRKLVYGLATVEVEFLDVSLDECLRRNKERTDRLANGELHIVPPAAIESMHKQWINHWSKVKVDPLQIDLSRFVPDANLPGAIICDIDGTMAIMGDRSPFAWHKVGVDTVNEMVRYIINCAEDSGWEIVMLSGRDEVCRPETEAWLKQNGVAYHDLFMRPQNNNQKDSIVKYDLMCNYILPKYNPMLCLDDRDQVVALWRSLGIPTWQVNEGDF